MTDRSHRAGQLRKNKPQEAVQHRCGTARELLRPLLERALDTGGIGVYRSERGIYSSVISPFEIERLAALLRPRQRARQWLEIWARGGTLSLAPLEECWAPIRAVRRELAQIVGGLARAGGTVAFLSGPQARGLPVHADGEHLLVLQLGGKKHWRVFPHRTAPGRVDETILGLPQLRQTLTPGDSLFIPRGAPHCATTSSQEAISLTIGFAPGGASGDTWEGGGPALRVRDGGTTAAVELRLQPINLAKHAALAIAFRRDATAESFGSTSRFDASNGHGAQQYLDWLRARRDRPNAICAIAWLGELPVGQIELSTGDENAGYMHLLYLRPMARGTGLADELMKWARDWFDKRRCDRARLRVAAANERARRFYRRCGWQDLGADSSDRQLRIMERIFV